MSRGRILIFVQHLRGIGHLQRAAAIARAFVAGGFTVDLVSGGMPVPEIDLAGVTLHQLPPVLSPDDTYTRLVDGNGRAAGESLRRTRIAALLGLLEAVRPDAVLVEMFPFGRSQIGAEMTALVEAARASVPRPLILSSVRDIVAAKRSPERYAEMADQAAAWFDAVLVHGDERVLSFEESFPAAARIEERLHYTGYVLASPPPAAAPSADDGPGDVLISAGGGALGAALLHAAIEARAHEALHTDLANRRWRLLTGPNMPPADAARLGRAAGEGIVIERTRPDFPALLAAARLSVSLCGYNTALEVIASGVPAVLVPVGTGRQTEQHRRAAALSRLGLAEVLGEAALGGASLARAMTKAAAKGAAKARRTPGIDMSGAETSRRLVGRWLANRPAA